VPKPFHIVALFLYRNKKTFHIFQCFGIPTKILCTIQILFYKTQQLEQCLNFIWQMVLCYVTNVVFYFIDFAYLLPFVYYPAQRRQLYEHQQKQAKEVSILG